MSALYISGVGKEVWRQPLLRGGSFHPNHYGRFDLNDASGYYRFDFKAVFTEGTSVIRDACVTTTYTVTD